MPIKPLILNATMARATMTCGYCGKLSSAAVCPCGNNSFLKSQTRRLVKPQPEVHGDTLRWKGRGYSNFSELENEILKGAPYQKGDVLWVREPGRVVAHGHGMIKVEYLSDGIRMALQKPQRFQHAAWVHKLQGIPNGIFREACRSWFQVKDVRLQRLAEISRISKPESWLYL